MAIIKLHRFFDDAGNVQKFYSEDVYDKTTKQTIAQYIASTNTEIADLKTALAGKPAVEIVADITARDALTKVITGTLCWVEDASADATVDAGAAAYLARVDPEKTVGSAGWVEWVKVAEAESLDVVLSWANIKDKPTSAVADIDDAVTKRHVHDNKAIIDAIGKNDTTGNLTYNGVELNGETGIAYGDTFDNATSFHGKLVIVVEDYDESATSAPVEGA